MKNKYFPDWVKKIGVISLASKAPEKICKKSMRFFEQSGLEVKWDIIAKKQTDINKAKLFEKMWIDDSIDLIISERGGYGSASVCDVIDWNLLSSISKPFIGYSDITAFHLAMLKYGINTPIAGPMATEFFTRSNENIYASLKKILNDNYYSCNNRHKVEDLFDYIPFREQSNLSILNYGLAEGVLLPVNLTTFSSMIGTNYMPDLKDCILLIEDIAEEPYKIHRYLNQLKQSGILKKVKALLLGVFTKCGNVQEINKIFKEFSTYVNGPVVLGVNFGHIENSLIFPFGKKVFLQVDSEFIKKFKVLHSNCKVNK